MSFPKPDKPIEYFVDLIKQRKLDDELVEFWNPVVEDGWGHMIAGTVDFTYDPPTRHEDYGEYDAGEELGMQTATSDTTFSRWLDSHARDSIMAIRRKLKEGKSQTTLDYLNNLVNELDELIPLAESYQPEFKYKFVNQYHFEQCHPYLLAQLHELKSEIQRDYIDTFIVEPDPEPVAEVEIAEPALEGEGSGSAIVSASKLVWRKDPHLFYLLFAALYEEGFIENMEGKRALKSVAETLYRTFLIHQKQGSQAPVTFQSFYQNLKSTGLLQEDVRNNETKSLIIRMLNEIQAM